MLWLLCGLCKYFRYRYSVLHTGKILSRTVKTDSKSVFSLFQLFRLCEKGLLEFGIECLFSDINHFGN